MQYAKYLSLSRCGILIPLPCDSIVDIYFTVYQMYSYQKRLQLLPNEFNYTIFKLAKEIIKNCFFYIFCYGHFSLGKSHILLETLEVSKIIVLEEERIKK